MALDPDLLSIVVCPACRADLALRPAEAGAPADVREELVCAGCGNAYPVRDDIPVLLVDEARTTGTPGAA